MIILISIAMILGILSAIVNMKSPRQERIPTTTNLVKYFTDTRYL